ncbi:MAG: hypothetical protein RPU90_04295 [Candidatus Sedimenticola sp. (ex Thyasira tokunagai)]
MRKPLFMIIAMALSMLFLSAPLSAVEPPGMSPEPAYACPACHEATGAATVPDAIGAGSGDTSARALDGWPPLIGGGTSNGIPDLSTTQTIHSHSNGLDVGNCPLPHEKHVLRWHPGDHTGAPFLAASG